MKQENERRRWENEMEEQKQSYEQELEELRNKLRKQRTADSAVNNQEVNASDQCENFLPRHRRISLEY